MRISDMLTAIASWLESPNNEAVLLAEYHDDSLKVVAESFVLAAALIKNAADQVSEIEPPEPSKVTPESIEEIAALAAALDSTGDPQLKKQASVLDELLLSIAAPPPEGRKDLLDARTEELKKKYEDPRKELHEVNKLADSEKAIEKSQMTKEYKIMEAPLSTRYCPDHPGVQIARVGEHMWQCELDKKSYNFETGFELNNGAKVPGGDVAQQTQGINVPYHAIFDTREGRLGYNKAADGRNDLVKKAQSALPPGSPPLYDWIGKLEDAPKSRATKEEIESDIREAMRALEGEREDNNGSIDPTESMDERFRQLTKTHAWKTLSREQKLELLLALQGQRDALLPKSDQAAE